MFRCVFGAALKYRVGARLFAPAWWWRPPHLVPLPLLPAVATGAARTRYESSVLVRESLEAQNQAVSGVSIDEEAIDLMTLQRQFQAAARFITVIDEAMQVLLSIA